MSNTEQVSTLAIRRQMLAEFWFYFRQNRGAVAGLFIFVLLVLTAVLAPLLAPMTRQRNFVMPCLCRPSGKRAGRHHSFWAPMPSAGTCCRG